MAKYSVVMFALAASLFISPVALAETGDWQHKEEIQRLKEKIANVRAAQNAMTVVELDPDNADGWRQLGNAWMRLGNIKEAVYSYEIAKHITEKKGLLPVDPKVKP